MGGSNNKPASQNQGGGLSWSSPASAPASNANAMNANAAKNNVQNKPAEKPQQKPAANATTTAAAKNSTFRWVVGGVLVGVVLVVAWLTFGTRAQAPVTSSTTSTTQDTATDTTATVGTTSSAISAGDVFGLTIPSPQDAGTAVQILSVSVSQPTWVVVYESRAGKPGNVLGAQLFFPENTNGSVNLLRATISGQTYFVGESFDSGNHKFTLSNEKVHDQQGNPFYTSFTTR